VHANNHCFITSHLTMITISGSRNNIIVTSAAVLASSLVTAAICCNILERRNRRSNSKWEKKRQEERTGRIRAEVKLREALSKLKKAKIETDDEHVLPLSTVGIVHSPYPKRMGTPRQGALVPSSRGCIQFLSPLPAEVLDGIDAYSHLWVIFQFHENTNLGTSKKTKIRPPRGGGIKVGQLATRSPHRPNPLGLSLVTIDRWEPSTRRLYIKALDLVDGTPGKFKANVNFTCLFIFFCL
jgi:tRNA-Thr(GGU) m(6)t(6)A37 methyltransferase TsaA